MSGDITLRYLLFGEDKSASKALKGVGKQAETTLGSVKKGASGLGMALGAVGVAAFAKSAVDASATFGSTMSQIAAATHAPQAEMDQLNDLAVKLGQDTIYSANDAADAMLELAKSGLDPATIRSGALESALTLAAASGMELADAGHAMSNAMNMFGIDGQQSAKVANALAGAANASSASVEDLSLGLAQVGPGAAAAGQSISEVAGSLALFVNQGLKGSDAGTSLKQMLARLTPSSQTAATAMESLGLFTNDLAKAQEFLASKGIKVADNQKAINEGFNEAAKRAAGAGASTEQVAAAYSKLTTEAGASHNAFFKANGEMKSATKIAQILQDATKNLSDEQRIAALNTIFGSDASRAAGMMAKSGAAGLREYIKAAQDQSSAQEMANARMSGLKGALERASGAIDTFKLQLGNALAPIVVSSANLLSDYLAPALGEVADFLSAHPTALQAVLGTLVGVLVAVKVAQLGMATASGIAALAMKADAAATWLATAAQAASRTTIGTWIGVKAIELGAWLQGIAAKTTDLILLGSIKAAQMAGAVATGVMTAAQWALNAAMSANPIALVIIAIVALIAAIVIAWKHSDTFRRIVTKAFHAVLDAASSAFGWVKRNWPLLLAIITGPIGLAVLAVAKNWDKIKAGASAAKNWISDKFDALVRFVSGLPRRIASAASGMWSSISGGFKTALNDIIGWWNHLSFSLPSVGIPGTNKKIGGFTLSTPDIHYLASGGIVTRPTLAVIGEAGPEAVVPLSAGRRGLSNTEPEVVQVNLYLDGQKVHQSLLKLKRDKGGLALGLS
ncbi:phage tail tape measure protein [Nocardioides jejuensis]|uniref:Phage tail tape measure protein n=1 Tax=Nocardioides jejuensis TaxID=2502782 RepID=A0A4R1BZ38_9ACTN|nr:phage tail tape measure protein [Nocardioides jejuensis]TCJ23018.1 phage tail tape measure protein [Nocardioides jejuensis]